MPKRTSAATSSSQRSRSSGSSASLEDADDSPGGGRSLRTATHESSTSNGRTRPSSRTSATVPLESTLPPQATPGTSLLLRFISSFRQPSSTSTPSRPFLPRSISSPGVGSSALSTTRQPLPASSLHLNLPAASTSSSSLRMKFRPSFRRRATTGSPNTSPPLSLQSSPALCTGERSPESPGSSRERDPMDGVFVGGPRPATFHSQGTIGSISMGKRGSIASERTVQQGDGSHASGTTPSLPSPLGAHQPVGDPLSPSAQASRPPLEHPLSVVAILLPPALLLLAQLGPVHLFSPPIPLPSFDSVFNPISRRTSVNSNALSASDQASITSSRTSNSSFPSLGGNVSVTSAYSHELHAPSTISVPAVSAAAIWRLFRGFEWIGEAGREGSSLLQEVEEGDEEDKVFDFAALLQGVADVLAADAGSRGVELVIGQVGSGSFPSPASTPGAENAQTLETREMEKDTASRELLVRADERAWGVVLVWILHHILADAAPGATVEVRFLAAAAQAPSVPTPEASVGSEDTAIPTRRSLQEWWTVSLDVLHTFSATAAATFDSDTPPPSLPSPAFSTSSAKSLFAQLDLQISAGPAEIGTQSWIVSGVLPGARPPVEEDDPSTRLGRQRATLGAVGHEPSMDELNKFSVADLKGTRVAVHAGEQSTFAKHLTMYLAGWGMDVSHVPLNGQSDPSSTGSGPGSAQDEGGKGAREGGARFDSGFGGSMDGGSPSTPAVNEPVNSPLKSSADLPSPGSSNGGAAESPYNLVIIDDDVPTLRRMLLALRAPPLHYAPSLMSKRPQLSTRRTRSSPHVRQMHQVPLANANSVIIHFASLTHYKAIKEIVQDALASSRSPSFPDVLVIPKPAGPRRILTTLWTALKRPAVDPSLPPIATSPTSPGIQYWTPRLSPALVNQQDFDTAAGDALASKGEQGNVGTRPRTPPIYFSGGPAGHPPSPLGKISDDQASYFSCVAEGMDGTTPSEGMVIQSPDGRPAIFFQPQTRSVRTASAKERANSRSTERDVDLHESPDDVGKSSPRTVAAPHEIGLGQGRRTVSNTTTASTDSLVLPAGTPALTLNSFITAAKSRVNSEDASREELKNTTPESILSRAASIRPSVSPRNGSGPSPSFVTRRSASGVSPPISPSATPVSQPNSSAPRAQPGTASPPSFYGRRPSGSSTVPRIRRHLTRKSTLPTVPPINVLIVEDNPINQTILSMFMKKKGIKYAVAKDGEEAVQKWKAGNFHLVLMDIQLPVKDGIEATREIREMERANNVGTFITSPNSDATSPSSSTSGGLSQLSSPTSPLLSMPVIIVALTASSLQVDRVTALAAGCNDFLTKPVSLPWLQQKLLEWGSMAYLSGFSQRGGSGSEASSNAGSFRRSVPAINAGLDSKADAISAHLHIEHKGLGSSSRSTSPAARGGPDLKVTSPTPIVSPDASSKATVPSVAPEVASTRVQAATGGFPPLPPPTDLDAVDSKLADFVSHPPPGRPGPSPLSPMRALDASLDSVVAEGARLVQVGKSRASSFAADSFGQVMHGSGAVSFDDTPLAVDVSKKGVEP